MPADKPPLAERIRDLLYDAERRTAEGASRRPDVSWDRARNVADEVAALEARVAELERERDAKQRSLVAQSQVLHELQGERDAARDERDQTRLEIAEAVTTGPANPRFARTNPAARYVNRPPKALRAALTCRGIEREYGVDRSLPAGLVRAGLLPALRRGRAFLVLRDDWERWWHSEALRRLRSAEAAVARMLEPDRARFVPPK